MAKKPLTSIIPGLADDASAAGGPPINAIQISGALSPEQAQCQLLAISLAQQQAEQKKRLVKVAINTTRDHLTDIIDKLNEEIATTQRDINAIDKEINESVTAFGKSHNHASLYSGAATALGAAGHPCETSSGAELSDDELSIYINTTLTITTPKASYRDSNTSINTKLAVAVPSDIVALIKKHDALQEELTALTKDRDQANIEKSSLAQEAERMMVKLDEAAIMADESGADLLNELVADLGKRSKSIRKRV